MFFRLTFPLFYGLFWSFSRLPFFVMYFLSDVLYFFLFTLIGYRKKVAYSNLKKAFPQKTEAEIQQILKDFYRHLCDVILEFFKMISMDESELRKRMRIVNPEVFDEINAKTEGVLALATHYGNFEWMSCATDMHTKNKGYAIYSPLKNPYFEALAVKTRERWGGELLPARAAIRNSLSKLDEPCIIGFICDQTPSRREGLYFTKFLGLTTAVHDRFAHLALQKAAQVYFIEVRKEKRGYYNLTLIPMPMTQFLPYSQENAHRFTDYHVALLEKLIVAQPEFWLWTHKRWKHQPQEGDLFSEKLSKPA